MARAEQTPEMRPTQEVRFAVVMYGGISLAIYMNGVAQELLKMVRATAPSMHDEQHAALADGELDGTEKVYRKLGRMLSWGAAAREPADAGSDTIRTRFVVDILSGSSAGGINAVYLAKALANDQPMDELQKLWIEEGEMGVLINDSASVDDVDLDQQVPPRSLLNGTRMYWKLLEALERMDKTPRDKDRYRARNAEELDLYVTATDMAGWPVKLQLADKVVKEFRHRNVFHFRYRDGDDAPNDFGVGDNPFLAFAARCTSAHPAAFEPMRLGDIDEVLETHPCYRERRDVKANNCGWRRFYKEYLRSEGVEDLDARAKSFLGRDFNDGGVLDNRPFRHATDAMPLRRAGVPVSRKLVYLDPTPERLKLQGKDEQPRRTIVENAWLSLSTLPRYEPIQEDLRRVLERNRLIERVGAIVEDMEERAFEERDRSYRAAWEERLASVKRQAGYTNNKWDQTTMSEMIRARGLAWAGYQHLRVTEVTDDLAVLITRGAGLDDDSDQFRAVRHLVRTWREERYDPDGESGKLTENAFLRRFDVQWRLRRLKFVLAKTDRMLAKRDNERVRKLVEQTIGPDLEAAGLDLGDKDSSFFKQLREALFAIREALSEAQTGLHRTRRSLWESREEHPLAEAIDGLGIEAADLESLLEPQTKTVLNVQAKAMYEQKKLRFEEISRLVQKHVGKALKATSKTCNQILPLLPANDLDPEASGGEIARRAVRFYYDDFASYDMISHPILYSTGVGEEMSQVDVFRISPRDAKSLIDEERSGKLKLAGTKLNNFGAFFEEKFRTNDILWGRLDGAERIITALLPLQDDETKREKLITEAHRAILAEGFEQEIELLRSLDEEVRASPEAQGGSEEDQLRHLQDKLKSLSSGLDEYCQVHAHRSLIRP